MHDIALGTVIQIRVFFEPRWVALDAKRESWLLSHDV